MNVNMLRDADNDAGFYAAICAADRTTTTWSGCTIHVSSDDTSYTALQGHSVEAVMGTCLTALPDFLGGNIVDELSSVTVSLTNGSLSSTTAAGLLAGSNACVIGDEILYFRDALLESEGIYTLTGLLRGRRGSEYAMAGHAIGDRFILANVSTLARIVQSTADIGIAKYYKAVTIGGTAADVDGRAFTNAGTPLMPYAPVQLGGGRDASGNLTINWVRRNRISGEWRDSVDVPNSESSEAYVVEIYDGSGYATVKRTISGLSSPTTSYSAANQTTDFGSPQATVYFRVYQLSAVVGRGHAASGAV